MLSSEFTSRLTSLGLTTGYTVRRGLLPPDPDKVIAAFETGGSGPFIAFGGATTENPNLQLVVRGAPRDSDGPRTTIEAIYQATMLWGAFTASNGTRYLGVMPLQAPFVRQRDVNERVEWAVNFAIEKELSAS